MHKLDAEFNRWSISKRDFEEAHEYLNAFEPSMDGTIQRALLTAAIVAYGRPFKNSFGVLKAKASISLPEGFFNVICIQLHKKLTKLRDSGVAHSDFELKPTGRVLRNDVGLMTWSKPFNPLSEGINIDLFKKVLTGHMVDTLYWTHG
jgi:hypothetical protein